MDNLFLHLSEISNADNVLQEISILRKMPLKVFATLHLVFSPNLKRFWTISVEKLMNISWLVLSDSEIFSQ